VDDGSTRRPGAATAIRGRWLIVLAWLALAAAVGSLTVRGIARGAVDSGDLAIGYAAVRAWIDGEDPYDPAVIDAELAASGGTPLQNGPADSDLLNVYFPTTIPMFLPIAFPTWSAGRLVALAINVVAAAFVAFGLLRLLDWHRLAPRALFLIAFFLALAATRTTIASGQTGIVATAGIIGAVLLQRSDRGVAAGVVLGLATAIKIQLGLPFLLYFMWRRRWPTVVTATVVLAGLTVISVVRMAVAGVPWLASWMANLDVLSSPGGLNDPGRLNPQRYSLVNLQYLLESLGIGGSAAFILTIALIGAAGLFTVWLITGRNPRQELLALSIVAVLGLLVTYHRYYDAVILALPLAWAFCAVRSARRWQAIATLILCGVFILPIPTNLWDLQQAGALPSRLVESAFWEPVILAHEAWALALMVIVLIWAAIRTRAAVEQSQAGEGSATDLSMDACPPGSGESISPRSVPARA
jgi:hypothetical protein